MRAILVDTSVEDLNGHITEPHGRSQHGHLHSSLCASSFPQGHIADRRQKLIEHDLVLSTQHHNLEQPKVVHCAAVETIQEDQRNVCLAQEVQARRAKALLAGSVRLTPQFGISSPSSAVRPPAGCRRRF